ncbi:MAG: nucleotidyltransferase family protein [Chromatiales bacterium]|nr:nucleotidyltransferase family protein [Chromatiales bacterium]
MSTLDRILARREEFLAIMKRHGASNPRVFGSVARREDGPDSDVDLLVEMETGRSLVDLISLQQEIESNLGCRVDLLTPGSLNRHIRERILAEALPL